METLCRDLTNSLNEENKEVNSARCDSVKRKAFSPFELLANQVLYNPDEDDPEGEASHESYRIRMLRLSMGRAMKRYQKLRLENTEKYKWELDALRKENEGLRLSNRHWIMDAALAKEDLEISKSEVDSLSKKLNDMKKQNKENMDQLKVENESLKKEIQTLKCKLSSTNKQLEDQESTIADLKVKIEKGDREYKTSLYTRLMEKNEALEEQLKKQTSEFDELKKSRDFWKSEFNSKVVQNQTLKKEKQTVENENKSLREEKIKLERHEKVKETLTEENENLKEGNKALMEKTWTLGMEKGSLQKDKLFLSGELNLVKDKLASAESKVTSLTEDIKVMKAENIKLKSELSLKNNGQTSNGEPSTEPESLNEAVENKQESHENSHQNVREETTSKQTNKETTRQNTAVLLSDINFIAAEIKNRLHFAKTKSVKNKQKSRESSDQNKREETSKQTDKGSKRQDTAVLGSADNTSVLGGTDNTSVLGGTDNTSALEGTEESTPLAEVEDIATEIKNRLIFDGAREVN